MQTCSCFRISHIIKQPVCLCGNKHTCVTLTQSVSTLPVCVCVCVCVCVSVCVCVCVCHCWKRSSVRPGKYLDERQPPNTRCFFSKFAELLPELANLSV